MGAHVLYSRLDFYKFINVGRDEVGSRLIFVVEDAMLFINQDVIPVVPGTYHVELVLAQGHPHRAQRS